MEGLRQSRGGRTDEWVLCGRKPWRTLQNYPEVNSAIPVPTVEIENPLRIKLPRVAPSERIAKILYFLPTARFSKIDLQKLIKLALFLCVVGGFSRPLGGTSVAVYLSDECRRQTSKITRMRLYSTEI